MKSIKIFGLVAFAVLMAMALVGDSSAAAEKTVLCKADGNTCAESKQVTHVHEASITNALLLNSLGNVKCAVLFLSTAVGNVAAPQVIKGNFAYSDCKRKKSPISEENCTVAELNGPAEIKVLKTSHETARVTGAGEVEVLCGMAIQCVYNGVGLEATAKGPLLR